MNPLDIFNWLHGEAFRLENEEAQRKAMEEAAYANPGQYAAQGKEQKENVYDSLSGLTFKNQRFVTPLFLNLMH